MKRIYSLLLVTALVFTFIPVSASANENQLPTLGILEINAEEVTVSEPMTYEEMLAICAESPYDIQWLDQVKPQATTNAPITYRRLSVPLYVTDEYVPRLDFYCETSEYGNYWGILSIYSIQMNKEYNGISKQFSGDLSVWLRSAYQIEYIINGNFLENGTTTVSGNFAVQGKVDELVQVTFGVTSSTSSNFYKYFYDWKIVSFQS